MHPHAAVEIRVRRLLGRQLDVAANRAATDLFRAAVGRFHDAGSAAGHDGETQPRNCRAHLPREFVMWIVTLTRAEPKTVTHGPTKCRTRKPRRKSRITLSRVMNSS